MILRLGCERVFESHQCLICGVVKADPSETMCSLCVAMLRAVMKREWFRNLHEELIEDEEFMRAHWHNRQAAEPKSELTNEDREFLKAMAIKL
jgi:hypothetical protein